MLSLYIDYEIFVDFVQRESRSSSVLDSDEASRQLWQSLWQFLKSGADVTILNVPEEINESTSRYLTFLTEGRGTSNITLTKDFKKPFKNIFDENKYFQSIFFLNEQSEEERKRYQSKNSIPIGFIEDYLSLYEEISFVNQHKLIPVRPGAKQPHSWDFLRSYLRFCTDVILIDNYILNDKSIIDSNLVSIIKGILENKSTINLTIVSYDDEKLPFDINERYRILKENFQNHNLNFKFNLVFMTRSLKEHDRNIITNFTRIKSGDSFNYFNSKGDLITKGTELDVYSFTKPEYFESTKQIVNAILKSISTLPEHKKHCLNTNRLINE